MIYNCPFNFITKKVKKYVFGSNIKKVVCTKRFMNLVDDNYGKNGLLPAASIFFKPDDGFGSLKRGNLVKSSHDLDLRRISLR